MNHTEISITLKLFAAYQEAYKVPELQLTLSPGTTVSQLLEKLISQHPELEKWRNVTKFGINLNFVPGETILKDGDEVVLIPPVSGGLNSFRI
ncbi:MoaD/ThiS family protein [Hydrocoleum sp. CS-953]|uniref:MoaD/ThiS family protein n=1 Tax=Microcoleaceae TaxID=1892252 RepID=UPI000B9B4235|nr:MoaD/ThiS family protein [Hydrocoleum sp. CS-953]OZH54679.1 MoaD family protein [Hydrocoleum sp. CS-953]